MTVLFYISEKISFIILSYSGSKLAVTSSKQMIPEEVRSPLIRFMIYFCPCEIFFPSSSNCILFSVTLLNLSK